MNRKFFIECKMLRILCTVVLVLVCFSTTMVKAQNLGTITGRVLDKETREIIPFANVIVEGIQSGTVTDENGEFYLSQVPLGYVNVLTSFVGYEVERSEDVFVTVNTAPFVLVELQPTIRILDEVVVEASPFETSEISPIARQIIGVREIEKSPGGNRDISKVIQSLPGVGTSPGFRNDVLIRGGSPGENKFYLDEIEIPVINHFQTQGASGGPVGLINTDLLLQAELLTGAFPANRGNALSSFLDLRLKNGNRERLKSRVTLGSSDAGITLDGPINNSTQFILSARQSYLKYLFDALNLPFLPTYNDFQIKVSKEINDQTYISLVGVGSLDQFELNENVMDEITD